MSYLTKGLSKEYLERSLQSLNLKDIKYYRFSNLSKSSLNITSLTLHWKYFPVELLICNGLGGFMSYYVGYSVTAPINDLQSG